jgi:hypothetical protein
VSSRCRPRPGQREQACVRGGKKPDHLGELALPPEEGGSGDGEIRAVEGLERREVAVSELVDALGGGEIFEPMLAEVR